VRAVPAIGSRAGPNAVHGPPKTLGNRRVRWSRKGVFARMMDATDLKAHRTASSVGDRKGGPRFIGRTRG
jgi:hypothetical protein